MAITLGDNFSYQGAKPLDGRLKYDTVAAMASMADSVLYDGCLAYCVATDKTYQWKSSNTVDPTTGKWREFETGGGQVIQYDSLPTASASNVGQIVQYTGATGGNLTNGFFYECTSDGETPPTYSWTEIGVQSSGTVPVMRGATNYTDGESGLAPKPYTTDVGKALFADGKYHTIYTAASGSTILVVTTDSSLYGRTVTLTDGTHTETETMGNNGECYFTDVQMFGSVTLSCTDAQSNESRASLNLTYFGTYQCNLSLNYATLHFTSTDLNMIGEEVVVYYDGTQVATTSLRSSGGALSADVYIEELGTYTVKIENSSKGMADASVTVTALQQTYTVPLLIYHLYGVEWDGSASTVLSRTDMARDFTNPVPYVAGASVYSSPFDDIAPWSGMVRVSNADAGELVKIPKFWYKLDTSSGFKLQIADAAANGFSVAPAFMDRGDGAGERDYAYVGRYHCSSTNWKSLTGITPKVMIERSTARSSIHALGSDIWQWDYAMLITIQMLYLVEFANWNCQAVIGGGCSQTTSSSSAVFNCGGTDSMPYHTGTVSANHSDYGNCQYRYIENLWGNCMDWCDGIYFSGANTYAIKNPANFSENANGTLVRQRPTSTGYVSAIAKSTVSGFDWFYYPSAVAGSDSTYIPDYCYYDSSANTIRVGGYYALGQRWGLFTIFGSDINGYSADINCGSRLMYLP